MARFILQGIVASWAVELCLQLDITFPLALVLSVRTETLTKVLISESGAVHYVESFPVRKKYRFLISAVNTNDY